MIKQMLLGLVLTIGIGTGVVSSQDRGYRPYGNQQTYQHCYYVYDYYGNRVVKCDSYKNYGQWRRHRYDKKYHDYYRHNHNKTGFQIEITR